jgi:hypothetical protein
VASHAGPVYEARYGRTPKQIFSIGFGLVISAIFVPLSAPVWPKVIVVGGFGGVAVMLAAMSFSRPALRVDAAGVTIRPYPLRFKVIAFYPWNDVVRIVIMRFQGSKGQYVQVQLREGAVWSAVSRATATRPRSRKALTFAAFEGAGVAVNGWTLHLPSLAAAVAGFAPDVQVIDAATNSVINPG